MPSWMAPAGARIMPPCSMVAAPKMSAPPAESGGAGSVPLPWIVICPLAKNRPALGNVGTTPAITSATAPVDGSICPAVKVTFPAETMLVEALAACGTAGCRSAARVAGRKRISPVLSKLTVLNPDSFTLRVGGVAPGLGGTRSIVLLMPN